MAFKKKISLDTEKLIWRIIHDANQNLLLMECRDANEIETSFTLLRLSNGEEIFSDLYFEETWWISAAVLTEEIIVFQTYDDEQDPSTKSSFAYNFKSNEVLWQKRGLTINEAQGDVLIGVLKEDDDQKSIHVSLRSGEISSGITEINKKSEPSPARYPYSYIPEYEHYDSIREYIEAEFEIKITHAIDYLEYGHYVILSFYTQSEKKQWLHHIAVVDDSGEVILRDNMNENLSGTAQDSFYILADYLIYIRKKTEICIYAL